MAIKEATTLSDAQKESAATSVDKCFSATFNWPQPLDQYKNMANYIEEGAFTYFVAMLKLLIEWLVFLS